VYCQGEGASQEILRVNLINIRGPGIKINKGNMAKIKGCDITHSKSGIEVVSAQPTIIMNTLEQN